MDADNNGALDFGEMLQALQELGVFDGVTVHSLQMTILKSASCDLEVTPVKGLCGSAIACTLSTPV